MAPEPITTQYCTGERVQCNSIGPAQAQPPMTEHADRKPTIIHRKAGNWVDRGESPLPVLTRILAHFFGRLDDENLTWLRDHANTVLGMVAADASEIHIAGVLRSIALDEGLDWMALPPVRPVSIALWHAAKVALVRDFAERVLRADIPANVPTDGPLGAWLVERILSPDELAAYEDAGLDAIRDAD